MNDTHGPPLETEIDPRVESRLRMLEKQHVEHNAAIDHWKGVALAAGALAEKVAKGMKEDPARHGVLVRNVFAIVGLGCVGVGCWWISPAASLVCIGSVLLGAVVLGTAARYKLEVERVRSDR